MQAFRSVGSSSRLFMAFAWSFQNSENQDSSVP